jgi:hypothetical protein
LAAAALSWENTRQNGRQVASLRGKMPDSIAMATGKFKVAVKLWISPFGQVRTVEEDTVRSTVRCQYNNRQ